MKTLILCQNLNVKGSSEGIVSNGFVIKYLKLFPEHQVDIKWIGNIPNNLKSNNQLSYEIDTYKISYRNYSWIENKLSGLLYKFFDFNIKDFLILKKFKKAVHNIDFSSYDNVFVRSGGLDFYLIRAMKGNSYLNKMIIYFHDPYPAKLYPGTSNNKLRKNDFKKIKEMREIIGKVKNIYSPSKFLSNDLSFLYGKRFKVLPHQFDEKMFNKSNLKIDTSLRKGGNYIMYHGAIQHNRNIELILSIFNEIIKNNVLFNDFIFLVRASGINVEKLKRQYEKSKNIMFCKVINTYDSYIEQRDVAKLSIVLETEGEYSNILGGKIPMLVDINANIFCITSKESELKRLLKDHTSYYSDYNKLELKNKLEIKLNQILKEQFRSNPLKNYFSEEQFKDKIIELLK